MEEIPTDPSAIRNLIATAFNGVKLGSGISIRQSQMIDRYREVVSDAEFDRLPLQETTDNWSRVSLKELERICVGHLDAEGYRFYIPALMLSVLSHYDASSMRVIGTISSLYPKRDRWAYHMNQYSSLSQTQLRTIASYVNALPELVPLAGDHRVIIPRAIRNYWGQFLKQ